MSNIKEGYVVKFKSKEWFEGNRGYDRYVMSKKPYNNSGGKTARRNLLFITEEEIKNDPSLLDYFLIFDRIDLCNKTATVTEVYEDGTFNTNISGLELFCEEFVTIIKGGIPIYLVRNDEYYQIYKNTPVNVDGAGPGVICGYRRRDSQTLIMASTKEEGWKDVSDEDVIFKKENNELGYFYARVGEFKTIYHAK